jgi:GNAT superfamily N-acetyltransferase
MNQILRNPEQDQLLQALEENLAERTALWEGSPGVELYRSHDRIQTVNLLMPYPIANQVMRARFSAEEADGKIAEIVARYRQSELPMNWWTGPASQPQDLGQRLLAHGMRRYETEVGMAADLDSIAYTRPVSDDLSLDKVNDENDLRDFFKPFAADFPPEFAAAFYKFYLARGFSDERPFNQYVARSCGLPVTTVSVLYAAGVAGVYNVTTLGEYRRRGFASALTVRALADARQRGYHVAVLAASAMGHPVYLNLGFREVCKLNIYTLSPA